MKRISARYRFLCLQMFSLCCLVFTDGQTWYTTSTESSNRSQTTETTPITSTQRRTEASTTVFRTTRTTFKATTRTTWKTTTTATPGTVYCNRSVSTGCPDGWFPADEVNCLYVSATAVDVYDYRYISLSSGKNCDSIGGSLLDDTYNTRTMRSCLTKVLPPRYYYAKSILLKGNRILNLDSGDVSRSYYSSDAYLVCITSKNNNDPPLAISFNLRIMDPMNGTERTVDLAKKNDTFLTIEESEDILNFSCQSNQQVPALMKVKLETVHSVYQNWSHPLSGLITSANCDHSGIYSCVANNGFSVVRIDKEIRIKHSMELVSFTARSSSLYRSDDVLRSYDNVNIACSVRACPPPKVMSIVDRRQLEIFSVHGNSSITYQLSRLRCSDMGQYICKAEAENGDVLERTIDLVVDGRCDPQLCRGELHESVIPAAIGQTVNISVCLQSVETLVARRALPTNSSVLVTLTRDTSSKTTITATMSVTVLREADYGSHIIEITNINGEVYYNLTVISPDAPHLDTPLSQYDRQAHESTHSLLVPLLLVSINIILVAMFVVMVYINREQLENCRCCNIARRSDYQKFGKQNGHHVNEGFMVTGDSNVCLTSAHHDDTPI